MAGVTSASWSEWDLRAEGNLPPRPLEADMLAANAAVTTS